MWPDAPQSDHPHSITISYQYLVSFATDIFRLQRATFAMTQAAVAHQEIEPKEKRLELGNVTLIMGRIAKTSPADA